MTKIRNLSKAAVLSMVVGTLVCPTAVEAYTLNNEFNLESWQGSPNTAKNLFIIIHETANPRSTGRDEAGNMKNNYNGWNPYTTDVVGDGGIVYRVGQWGKVSWGAGNANRLAPVQIELQHTYDPTLFRKNYIAYVDLIRDAAKTFNIPLTLDEGGAYTPGVKSHAWVANRFQGDHTDPYGYLAEMGISKEQLAHDIKFGVDGSTPDVTPPAPPAPAPEVNGDFESVSGSYTFTTTTNIRNGLGVNGEHSGYVYPSGDTVIYDRIYRNVDGYDWLSYVSYSGQRRFVAMIDGNEPVSTPESGAFTFNYNTNIRTAPGLSGGLSGYFYPAGETVYYDSIVHDVDGYDWLSYVSYSGVRHYVAVL